MRGVRRAAVRDAAAGPAADLRTPQVVRYDMIVSNSRADNPLQLPPDTQAVRDEASGREDGPGLAVPHPGRGARARGRQRDLPAQSAAAGRAGGRPQQRVLGGGPRPRQLLAAGLVIPLLHLPAPQAVPGGAGGRAQQHAQLELRAHPLRGLAPPHRQARRGLQVSCDWRRADLISDWCTGTTASAW